MEERITIKSRNPAVRYSYDANGNRTNTGYTTGDNNQVTSDGTYDYVYDDEGNRTKKTHATTGDYVEYTWDHRNRLTAVTFRDSSDVKTKEVTYVYDVFDRRIAKDVDDDGGGTIDWGERYVYDSAGKLDPGAGVPLDDIALAYDRSDNLIERLLHGPGIDQPLATEDSSGNVLWFLADNQGTIRDVAEYDDVSGDTTVVNHLTYGGFGNITAQSNSSNEPRHTYTGREWDADAELFYYRARWYDPVVGKFISEDPLGFVAGDVNITRFAHNSAINFTDPTGLAGTSRTLTDTEAQALEVIISSAMPRLQQREHTRVALARVLSRTTLWDANTISGWHTFHAWNIIAQASINYGGAGAVTLGTDQYYRHFPAPNDVSRLPLIGHETMHSLHADMMTSSTAFLIGYAADSATAAIFEDDAYLDNVSEWLGHAMEHTIEDMINDPTFMAYYNAGRVAAIPDPIRDTIRMRFSNHMSEAMQATQQ